MEKYHYSESGLDYVWLVNGFERHDTPYGSGVSIHDVDGLHALIGMRIAEQSNTLSGAEVRFLRHELDLSQKALGSLLGVKDQTVARWEKEAVSIPGPAQRLLSALYREAITGDSNLSDGLKRLTELDVSIHAMINLARSDNEEWIVCAA